MADQNMRLALPFSIFPRAPLSMHHSQHTHIEYMPSTMKQITFDQAYRKILIGRMVLR